MKFSVKFLLFVSLIVVEIFALGATKAWIEPVPGSESEKYYVGEVINLQIRVDTFNEKINGTAFFMTLDPRFFRIVPQESEKPFLQGNFFSTNPEYNGYHDEDTPDNPDANGIYGLQLDYYQQTEIGTGSNRDYVQGEGVVAYFDVKVVGIPEGDESDYAIDFDYDFLNVRESGYYLHQKPGQLNKFNFVVPFVADILGSSIDPPFADTTITPGTNYQKYLGDHFFGEDFDKEDAIWNFAILQNVDGVSIDLNTANDADILTITSENNSHGLLKLNMIMGIEGSSFSTSQQWNIAINHRPEFIYPITDVEILEDVDYKLYLSNLIRDLDDDFENMEILFTGDTLVSAVHTDNYIKLSSLENWYGDTKITISVSDNLSDPVSEEINVTVKPVNDAPVINLSNDIDIQNDTLDIHHDEEKMIDLKNAVIDVDDTEFTWLINGDSQLNTSLSEDDILTLSVKESSSDFYGTIPIILSVYDAAAEWDKDTLQVNVISYEPEFSKINPILMHSDSTKKINIGEFASDKDTPTDELTFEFAAIDSTTKEVDNNVDLDFNDTTDQLVISATSGHSANDYLQITAKDNSGNEVTINVILVITDTYAPKFVIIPPLTVYQDSTETINLNDYVFDVRDQSEDLILSISGNDIFKSVTINESNHHLTFESYSDIFGVDTLKLVAKNSYELKDSTNIVAYCIPKDKKPIFFDIADLDLYWNREYDWIDLDDYVFDAFTPDSLLEWEIEYTEDYFDLTVNDDNTTKIITKSLVSNGSITLNVTNLDGVSKTESVNVTIRQDTEPVWSSFEDIYMVKTDPQRDMDWTIFEKCYDNETDADKMSYSATFDNSVLNVVINSITGKVSITVVDTTYSSTTLKFSATDQSSNTVTSQSIDVFISDGLPPVWKTIPTIYMKNTEVYEDLRLLDYCKDDDDNEDDLVFSALASNENITVEIDDDSNVKITPENGIFGENFFIIFKVTDTQENIIQKSVKVIISDDMPPKGYVNYVTNPVLSTRVDFIVATDISVNSVTPIFKKLPSTSITLNFSEMNTSENGKLWTDDYKFTSEGTYKLIIEMLDNNNIETYDTTLMTIDFPDNSGSQMSLGTGTATITLEYPEMNYSNKMFFVTENQLKSSSSSNLAKSIKSSEILSKSYNIHSGLNPNEVLFTLRFNPSEKLDNYYSFYKVIEDELVQIETWRSSEGEFKAYISEDCEICFQTSAIPAKEEIVPENQFICYPNPFNPTVNMKFLLTSTQKVELLIYNILGQKIYKEVKEFNPGINQISWNGKNQSGNFMPSGLYFVMISKNNKPMKIKKVTLFK